MKEKRWQFYELRKPPHYVPLFVVRRKSLKTNVEVLGKFGIMIDPITTKRSISREGKILYWYPLPLSPLIDRRGWYPADMPPPLHYGVLLFYSDGCMCEGTYCKKYGYSSGHSGKVLYWYKKPIMPPTDYNALVHEELYLREEKRNERAKE